MVLDPAAVADADGGGDEAVLAEHAAGADGGAGHDVDGVPDFCVGADVGAWVDGGQGKFPVLNPADGGQLVEVANCGPAEAQRAIDAAAKAYPAWRAKTAKERAACLRKWFELMMANVEDLAVLMTVFNLVLPARNVACGCEKTECGDAR